MALELKVIERHSSVASAYCGRLLGALGADVVKLEPPGGDPMRMASPRLTATDGAQTGALFEYLNCFKRSANPDDADAVLLMTAADLIIDYVDGDPDRALADFQRLSSVNPSLIYLTISSFGLTGPYRAYRGNDFVDFASGGYTFITGDPDREPVQAGGPLAGYLVGTTAAIAALAARRQLRRTGRGQLVDVGAMEAMAGAHQWSIVLYTHQGVVKRRAGNLHAESFNPLGPVPCRDGWVSVGVATAAQWDGFCVAIGMPELLRDDRFQSGGDRFDHAEELWELIRPAMMSMTAAEFTARCQELHVPAGPVQSVPDVLEDPHLHARGFWVAIERLGGARMPERAFGVPGADAPFRPAPLLGEHTGEVLAGWQVR